MSGLRGAQRSAQSGLTGEFLSVLALVMTRNVGPELDDFSAHDAFGRDRQPVCDGVGDRTLRSGVVDAGNRRANEVSPYVGVVRPP